LNKPKVPDIPKSKPTKREQVRAAKKRRSLVWNLIVLGTLGAFALLVVVFAIANQRPGPIAGEQAIPNEGTGVVQAGTALTFNHMPPSSGSHYAESAPWGLAATPVPPGHFVSNLAKGGVVILYQCAEPCPELEDRFKTLYDKTPPDRQFNARKMLITPYTDTLTSPIVALGWGYELGVKQYDEALLLQWYQRFVNQGPNNAP
jgi:hypothetical protein